MSETSTSTVIADAKESSPPSHQLLGSIGSLTLSKRESSIISRTYKEASKLYLTRRPSEAISVLEPIISRNQAEGNFHDDDQVIGSALIASASRKSRIMIWNLYLSILNAIIELGPDEGEATLGGKDWRRLAAKVRDGTIWDEVVEIGYGGIEANVDADVVANLATLLLTHSPSQTTNQQHLEFYLSASNPPHLDLPDHSPTSPLHNPATPSPAKYANGTDTPRDLHTRVKIIELYALHVLPRNEEWQYAKDFISMNEYLDEESRESFLQDLQSLEVEMKYPPAISSPIANPYHQSPQPAQPQPPNTIKLPSPHTQTPIPELQPTPSAKDYGLDDPTPPTYQPPNPKPKPNSKPKPLSGPSSSSHPLSSKQSKQPPPRPIRSQQHPLPFLNYLSHLTHHTLPTLIRTLTTSTSKHPILLLRMIFFLAALVVAFARRDVRDRVARMMDGAWKKVRGTVGMGMKVSYI